MRHVFIAAAMLAAAPAAAQSNYDCASGSTFRMSELASRMVEAISLRQLANPAGAYLQAADGRCEPGTSRVWVCAVMRQFGKDGNKLETRLVFGTFDRSTGLFNPSMSGPYASSACLINVYGQ